MSKFDIFDISLWFKDCFCDIDDIKVLKCSFYLL